MQENIRQNIQPLNIFTEIMPSLRSSSRATGVKWNKFREYYDCISFKEREKLSELWDELYPEQRYFHKKQFIKMLNMIDDELYVVELGSHNGDLAEEVIPKVPNIVSWNGYDFRTFIDNFKNIDRYTFNHLKNWFYETELPGFNAFVSSHTLEHLSDDHAYETLKHISKAKYVLLEVPINEKGRTWHNWGCGHVLTWGRKKLKEVMNELGYELFYESPDVWATGWQK